MNAKQPRQRPRNHLAPVARAVHSEARTSLGRAQARLGVLLAAKGVDVLDAPADLAGAEH